MAPIEQIQTHEEKRIRSEQIQTNLFSAEMRPGAHGSLEWKVSTVWEGDLMQCVSAVSDEVTSVRHVMEHNPGPSLGWLQSCVGASQIRPALTVSAHSDVLTRSFAKKTINTRWGREARLTSPSYPSWHVPTLLL